MKFEKDKIYTVLNADELHIDDVVYLADNLEALKNKVKDGDKMEQTEIARIRGEDCVKRFETRSGATYSLAYLVKSAPKPTHRPYKDIDELLQDWDRRVNISFGMSIPKTEPSPLIPGLIWIKAKLDKHEYLVLALERYDNSPGAVRIASGSVTLPMLLDCYTYVDGSPCGIKL